MHVNSFHELCEKSDVYYLPSLCRLCIGTYVTTLYTLRWFCTIHLTLYITVLHWYRIVRLYRIVCTYCHYVSCKIPEFPHRINKAYTVSIYLSIESSRNVLLFSIAQSLNSNLVFLQETLKLPNMLTPTGRP